MNILVLEDSQERMKFFRRWCIGHTLVEAVTAQQAIKAIDETVFDLIFLDHDLGIDDQGQPGSPENSGMTVAKYLCNKEAELDNSPFIVVHSHNHGRVEEMMRWLSAHFVAIPWPFNPTNMEEKLPKLFADITADLEKPERKQP
jgi:CheY-like chemotaxis protein